MRELVFTIILVLATLACVFASVLAIIRLRQQSRGQMLDPAIRWVIGSCALLGVALFTYRALFIHGGWMPLEAHLDGLLLVITLMATATLFLEMRWQMSGVTAFILPLMTLLLAWSVCASSFTDRLFQIDSIWNGVHLTSNYLGTLFFAIAASGGGS